MSFWRLMAYAFSVFVGLVIVFLVLPKVFGLIARLIHRDAKTKKQQGKYQKR